jgi:hypothetical protein
MPFRIRNFLLTQTDWTQVSDNALTQEEKDAWAIYRQALREIDIQNPHPVWPTPPSKIECVPEPPEWLMMSTVYKDLY